MGRAEQEGGGRRVSVIPTSRAQGGTGGTAVTRPDPKLLGGQECQVQTTGLYPGDSRCLGVPGQEVVSEFLTAVSEPRGQRAQWFHAR